MCHIIRITIPEAKTMEVQSDTMIKPDKKPTHFMLASRITILISVALLYAMQITLALPIFGTFVIKKNLGSIDNRRVDVVVTLLIAALVLDFVSFILAILGSAKQEDPRTKMSVITKIIMIPFFLINITLWCLLISGMLNPFLLFGIPFIAVLGICLTYIYMFMTSWPDIIYMIIFTLKSKKRPKALIVAGIILEFFFVLDIVGAVMIDKAHKLR